jgi:hypothetical protein
MYMQLWMAITTKSKENYRTTMRDFVASTKVKEKRDELALVATTLLQGDFHDKFLRKEVYWG